MTETDPEATTVWTLPAFRAREAQARHLELHDQDRAELEKRDRAIKEAVDGGAPIRQLAPMVGVTRQTIYNVLGTDRAAG